jgi:multiple sugar transport system permease protein
MSPPIERRRHLLVRAGAIGLLCVLFLLPLAFMVAGSLRLPGLPPARGFQWIPDSVQTDNYRAVFAFAPLWSNMLNSLIVVAGAVPLTVVIASWAGYAIAAADPKTQRRLIVLSLLALIVPVSALWVPRFAMFRWLGLTDSLWAVGSPALMATTPFYVLLFALAYARIPKNLYEAALLENMTPFQIWRRVAFPLGKPVTFAVALLAFIFHWSNFTDALLYLSSLENFTLPLGLRALQTLEPALHPIMLAGSVIATAPAVVAFFVAQRSFFSKVLEV